MKIMQTHKQTLRENPALSPSRLHFLPRREISVKQPKPAVSPATQTIRKEKNKKIISLDELEKEIDASPDNNYDEYAYPFGAWLDDKNHK